MRLWGLGLYRIRSHPEQPKRQMGTCSVLRKNRWCKSNINRLCSMATPHKISKTCTLRYFEFSLFCLFLREKNNPFFLRSISRPSLLQLKAVIQSVAKWPLYSLSALVVALLKSCPHPRVAVVPGLWPPLCPRPPTATWWPLRPSWPLSTRRMRKARSKPSPECHRRRPPAFFTTWKRPYETGNQSASFKTQSPLSSKAFKSSDNVCVWTIFSVHALPS